MAQQVFRRVVVSGRVQGVYYRAATAARAREVGVRGHARNLPDGTVEVLAIGEREAVLQLLGWLWQGPSAARVRSLQVSVVAAGELEDPGAFTTG